jgi:hypothetical protein
MRLTAAVGQTQSGKTNLVMSIADELKRRQHLLVLTKQNLLGMPWPCHWKTANVEQFASVVARKRGIAFVVDECGETIGRNPEPHIAALATDSGNNGNTGFFIMQRGVQISLTMRDQFTAIYLFNVNPDDAEEWARVFNDKALLKASELPQYHFIFKRRFQPAIFCKPTRKMK